MCPFAWVVERGVARIHAANRQMGLHERAVKAEIRDPNLEAASGPIDRVASGEDHSAARIEKLPLNLPIKIGLPVP
jgi:hypothetical protein